MGQPGLHRVQQGPDEAPQEPGGRGSAGASHPGDHRELAPQVVGHGEPADGPAQDAADGAGFALQLLQVWLPLQEGHKNLAQLNLGGLGDHVPQGRPLPGLCGRRPPRGGPAASGRRRRLRHQRAAGGSGRSAGVDAEAGLEVPRAEAGERRLRGLHAAPESAAGVAAEQGADPGSAGRAVQALRGAREFDHVVPVHQAFRGQIQELQALCLECHRTKTALENSHATTLESRFSHRAYEAYVHSPRLPPLVCGLQKWDPDKLCHGIDVVRCRKNGLANARFPLPVFCPLDTIAEARQGHLADLTYVRLRKDSRMALLSRLPYVGEGWYAKPACAYMLEWRGDVAGLPVVFGRHRPRGAELPGLGAAQDGGGLGRGGAPGQAERERPNRPVGPQRGPAVPHADQQ